MTFLFQCPACKNELEAQTEWIGQETQCPCCSQNIVIPAPRKKSKKVLFISAGLLLFAVVCAVIAGISGRKTEVPAKKEVAKQIVPAKKDIVKKTVPVQKTEKKKEEKKIVYPFTVMHNSGIPRIEKTYDGLNRIELRNHYHYYLDNAAKGDNAWYVRFLLERNFFRYTEEEKIFTSNLRFKTYEALVVETARFSPESITVLAFLLENSEKFGMPLEKWNKIYDELVYFVCKTSKRGDDCSYMLPLFGYLASYGVSGTRRTDYLLERVDFDLKEKLLFVRANPPQIDKNAPVVTKLPKTKAEFSSGIPPIKNIPQKKVYEGPLWEKLIKTVTHQYLSRSDGDREHIAFCENIRSAVEQGLDINDIEHELFSKIPLDGDSLKTFYFMIENGADARIPQKQTPDGRNLLAGILSSSSRMKDLEKHIIYLAGKGIPVTHHAVTYAPNKEIYDLLIKLRKETGPHWDEHLIRKKEWNKKK